jgi:hypothetical protein
MLKLVEIPALDPKLETAWKVRALVVGDKDPVRAALSRWRRERPEDFKRIMKVMGLAAQQERVLNPKHVKKSNNESDGPVYEMLSYTGAARLMFFYDREAGAAIIVCTNDYEKSRGSQSAAFKLCGELRTLYFARKQEIR